MFSKLHPLLWVICILAGVLAGCERPSEKPEETVDKDIVVVCEEGESDFTTIQDAVDAVESGSTIEVCPGTYKENLLLEEKNITIRSQKGYESTIIEAAATGSTIRITDADAPGVTIEGFSIRGGNNANGLGGGVACQASTLELVDNAISNNSAANGGGLAATDCSVAISGNQIFNNQAKRRGGGALITTSEGTVEENDIFSNKAQEGGGIAVVSVGFQTAVGGLFNRADGETPSASDLAALILQPAPQPPVQALEPDGLLVKSNTIRENSASPRRAIMYNLKESGGGGIWIGGNTPLIENVVKDNKSTINGGGIYVLNANTTIVGNTIQGNQSGEDGGGLCINTCAGRIADNLFTENSSLDDAGGLRVYFGLNMQIENNTISKNEAVDASGGVKLSHSQNIFKNNIIEENQADTAGGLELDNDATIVQSCNFKGNLARLGAAIHSKAAEQILMIQDTLFEANIATEYGGALHFEHNAHPVILTKIEARGNEAKKGGFIATNNSQLEIVDAVLTGNKASEAGGALFFSGYEELLKDEAVSVPIDVTSNQEEPKLVKLRRVRMEQNSAAQGGALFAGEDTWLDAANLIVARNSADESGGGMQLTTVNGLLSNSVIDHNNAPSAAGILFNEVTGLEVQNCIITDNSAGEGVLIAGSPYDLWQYNNVHNNQGGDYAGVAPATGTDGNISQSPGFVNAGDADYHLRPDSHCADSGSPEASFSDADGSRSDMGAYGGPEGLWNKFEDEEG